MTPAIAHILLAVADQHRHGYAIMQEVERITDGAVRMGPGTLYGTIKRMMSAGLIEETDVRTESDSDDERRRYYRATAAGKRKRNGQSQRYRRRVKERKPPEKEAVSEAARVIPKKFFRWLLRPAWLL